jgi:CRISPR/Cas system-associated exonuclease Cas4 (RecB family)
MIDQMRALLDGGDVRASPHPIKCAKCDVRHRCAFRADVRAPAPTEKGEGSS